LVNLTCGRNPWKQASEEDTTYRAFKKDRNFLKTILPLSDELNEILGMVFESNPEDRITVSQLKTLIYHCQSFSRQEFSLPSPPQSPGNSHYASNVCSNSSGSSDSDYDSDGSDARSMCSSGSSSSDDSDNSECRSPEPFHSPMDVEIEVAEKQAPQEPVMAQRRQPLSDVTNQQYQLPNQEFHGTSYSKSSHHGYSHLYESQYVDQFYAGQAPQIFHPFHHHAFPQYHQFERPVW
jgi:serine/threonine protein kinase